MCVGVCVWGGGGGGDPSISLIRVHTSTQYRYDVIQLYHVFIINFVHYSCRYSKSLPLRVKVCKGFYGVSDQTAVTTGDLFNLHFVKNTKV